MTPAEGPACATPVPRWGASTLTALTQERENVCGKVRHHSVSLQRESRHATRISARDANLGHAGRISGMWGESRTFPMFQRPPNSTCVYFLSRPAKRISAHLGVLDRQGVRDASGRGRRGALPRTSLLLTQRLFTRNVPVRVIKVRNRRLQGRTAASAVRSRFARRGVAPER